MCFVGIAFINLSLVGKPIVYNLLVNDHYVNENTTIVKVLSINNAFFDASFFDKPLLVSSL